MLKNFKDIFISCFLFFKRSKDKFDTIICGSKPILMFTACRDEALINPVRDNQLLASSTHPHCSVSRSRLFSTKTSTSAGAWCANSLTSQSWIQVTLVLTKLKSYTQSTWKGSFAYIAVWTIEAYISVIFIWNDKNRKASAISSNFTDKN